MRGQGLERSGRRDGGRDQAPWPAEESPAPVDGETWRQAGCHRDPSTHDPDPALFFAPGEARELHASLLVALRIREGGLLVVTGEPGMGKTMVLRVFEAALRGSGEAVRFHDGAATALVAHLDQVRDGGRAGAAILVVDGAERCDDAILERLQRMLIPGLGEGPLRLVISGGPAVEARLQRMADTALTAEIPFARLRLEPIADALVGDFLMHRLWQSGFAGSPPLAPDALQRVIRGARGVPRRIVDLAAAELALAWQPETAAPATGQLGGLPSPGWALRLLSSAAMPLAGVAIVVAVGAALTAWHIRRPPVAAEAGLAPVPAAVTSRGPVPIAALAPQPVSPVVVTAELVLAARAAPAPESPPPAASTEPPAVEPPAAAAPSARPESDALAAALGAQGEPAAPDADAEAIMKGLLAGAEAQPVATPEATIAPAAGPPAAAAPPAAAPAIGPDQARAYRLRGDGFLRDGDIAAARLLYEKAAAGGDAAAMTSLARTYDAAALRQWGVLGLAPDPERAAHWYRRAEEAARAGR